MDRRGDWRESTFEGRRPVCLNGIEDVATRPDLVDRALMLLLVAIDAAHGTPILAKRRALQGPAAYSTADLWICIAGVTAAGLFGFGIYEVGGSCVRTDPGSVSAPSRRAHTGRRSSASRACGLGKASTAKLKRSRDYFVVLGESKDRETSAKIRASSAKQPTFEGLAVETTHGLQRRKNVPVRAAVTRSAFLR
jgi:hypothetical protein